MPIINCGKCNKEMYISPENVETKLLCPDCQKEKDKEWEKYWKNDETISDDSV